MPEALAAVLVSGAAQKLAVAEGVKLWLMALLPAVVMVPLKASEPARPAVVEGTTVLAAEV